MERKNLVVFVAMALLVASGLLYSKSSRAAGADTTTNPVHLWDPFPTTIGAQVPDASATFVRTDDGVTIVVHTFDLAPGAWTIWIFVFNDPSNCAGDPCRIPQDIGPANGAVLFGTAHVVTGGAANFASHIRVGDTTGQIGGPGNGLEDARGAELLVDIRHHGPVVPKLVKEQLSMVKGGCDELLGPNVCTNVQLSVDQP